MYKLEKASDVADLLEPSATTYCAIKKALPELLSVQ
jgi:hypothetical protein